jgi:hypothetical protein
MNSVPELANSPGGPSSRATSAWSYAALVLAVAVAYGAVWTRGVQGDDLCMCELANARGYWEAVLFWLEKWNSRLFLALTQLGSYRLPWFASPLQAPWFVLHAGVVLAHMAVSCLVFAWLTRADIKPSIALAASLVMAVHPVTFESVVWLAAAYGYVLGTLLAMLAVQAYLAFERTRRGAWLGLAVVLAFAASVGIEQYVVILAALAVVHLVRSRTQQPHALAWVPLAVVLGCAAVFVALHFGLFGGTGGRLAKVATTTPADGPGSLWKLAWFLSPLPAASPYGGVFQVGLGTLQRHVELSVLVALVLVVVGWRVAAAKAWNPAVTPSWRREHLWLVAAGLAAFAAALLPFAFTGAYGFSRRNLYPALPGVLVAGAVALDGIARSNIARRILRFLLPPLVTAGVAVSVVMDIGSQTIMASSWSFHRQLIERIESDADAVRSAGALVVTDIPANPYRAIAMIDNSWAFPCLVRWIVDDEQVRAWNNLMGAQHRPSFSAAPHVISWREL